MTGRTECGSVRGVLHGCQEERVGRFVIAFDLWQTDTHRARIKARHEDAQEPRSAFTHSLRLPFARYPSNESSRYAQTSWLVWRRSEWRGKTSCRFRLRFLIRSPTSRKDEGEGPAYLLGEEPSASPRKHRRRYVASQHHSVVRLTNLTPDLENAEIQVIRVRLSRTLD